MPRSRSRHAHRTVCSDRPHRRLTRSRVLGGVLALALLAVACGSGGGEPAGSGSDDPAAADGGAGSELAIAFASFDLAVGEDQRLLAGVFSQERQLLGFGEVTFQLGYLGDAAGGQAELDQEVTASFLPVPGMEPEGSGDAPRFLDDPLTSGVYEAAVDLDEPGNYGLRVLAELEDGTVLEGQTVFPVQAEPAVPAPGDPAPDAPNLTIADVESGAVAPVALDSRAQGEDDEIPDPHLHEVSIPDALAAGRPLVVIVATPVYCASRFCGPLVDTLSPLVDEYGDRADFVHLEVWEDFEEQQLNAGAAAWIQTETGGNEPWVFLVDADGRIQQRWDNVLDLEELTAALDALPSQDA